MSIDRRSTNSGYLPLRDAIDRLFAGSVISPSLLSGPMEGWPPTDLHMTDDDIVVQMAIPGANPDDINISVTGDTVTISGQVTRQFGGQSGQGGQGGQTGQSGQSGQSGQTITQQQGGQTTGQSGQQGKTGQAQGGQTTGHVQPLFEEIFRGRFQRSFTLPIQVEPNKANATFQNGILTLTLPKSEATKPRRIQVQPQSQQQTITQQGGQTGQPTGQSTHPGQTQTETVPVQSGSSSGGTGSQQ
ncbi:MAG TPA: Hsp20/alpha crystallin family protein [Chloroflexota bacterium]|nr:Hsp20/alpha crystallin family protein [Chloroflexota bacterium]